MTIDVLVIGGGHAGIEAAWAASRLGARTALVTMSVEAIGRMSCNPAIGGIGKGQIVREIDAMGGLMGLVTDEAGIQYRLLNRSKGPAVWSPRAQADRSLYTQAVLRYLRQAAGLEIVEGMVVEILSGEQDGRRRVRGVKLQDGQTIHAEAVILAAGTFLGGLLHIGPRQVRGGRVDEPPSDDLSRSLAGLGLRLGRLKTGTPPRLDRDSIDYSVLGRQDGDELPLPFSFLTGRIDRPQVPCWITWTNAATHEAIRANLHRAPLFTGQIQSRGPRYCPSIEDKVVRFADKDRHQVFLEPEGYDSDRVYCNGLATSLPIDVQEAMVHSVAGLENARIAQFGYAVEYDWVPTDQTTAWLEANAVAGLFLAGQVNGTSGYEEAAAQGLVAGVNAALQLAGREPLVLGRDQAYIGVMIDDLVTRPPTEPYRMFTSRAEYRLHLRSDNADTRLTPIGRRVGTVDDVRWAAFQEKQRQIADLLARLESTRHEGRSLSEWLRRPEVSLGDLASMAASLDLSGYGPQAREQVEIGIKYAGYLAREKRQIEKFAELERWKVPAEFDYGAVPHLRMEAREKMSVHRPMSLGQALRISGITPADVTVLMVHLEARRRTMRAS
jgi:tRNA uridine 5-carboxymethylaminomethyl modification enzyme